MFKKITLLGVMALLCLNFWAMAQTPALEIKPLKVGDSLPESFFTKTFTRISEFGDSVNFTFAKKANQLVILDFWATWCAPCITSLEALQPIQQQLGDSLLVLALNEQLPSTWQPFVKQKAWKLNSLLQVQYLKQLFPHVSIPHQIWILNGKVMQITTAHTATLANIRAILKGQPINAYQKIDPIDFAIQEPLFLNNNGVLGQTLQFQSILAKYNKTLPNNKVYFKIGPLTQITFANLGIMGIYQHLYAQLKDPALIYNNRSLNLLPDSLKNKIAPTTIDRQDIYSWLAGNAYNYSFSINKELTKSKLLETIISSLAIYFEAMRIKVALVERDQLCYVIVAPNKWGKLASNAPKSSIRQNKEGKLVFERIPQKDMVAYLQLKFKGLAYPLISDDLFDNEIDLTLKDVSNVNALAKSLEQAGLALHQTDRKVSMLVFTEKKGFDNE